MKTTRGTKQRKTTTLAALALGGNQTQGRRILYRTAGPAAKTKIASAHRRSNSGLVCPLSLAGSRQKSDAVIGPFSRRPYNLARPACKPTAQPPFTRVFAFLPERRKTLSAQRRGYGNVKERRALRASTKSDREKARHNGTGHREATCLYTCSTWPLKKQPWTIQQHPGNAAEPCLPRART